MRVWCIGLGMVGSEFSAIRKMLCAKLDGNTAWRYGKPEKVAHEEPATAPDTDDNAGENAPAPEEPAPDAEETEVTTDDAE